MAHNHLLFVCLHLGKGFDELSKVYVASHCPSKSLVVVKQTNVDVQNPAQLEDLKVCIQNFITVITAFTVGRVSLPSVSLVCAAFFLLVTVVDLELPDQSIRAKGYAAWVELIK